MGPVGINGQPLQFVSALTFFKGELYGYARDLIFWGNSNKFIKVNLDDLLNSTLVAEYSIFDIVEFQDLETMYYGCDSASIIAKIDPFGGGGGVFKLNKDNGNYTELCLQDGLLASPTAHQYLDCIPTLDLDPGESGLCHKADTTCLNSEIAYSIFASAAPMILTDTEIDSVWIGLRDGMLDGVEESLSCNECTSSGTGLVLHNDGQYDNEGFMSFLSNSITYLNNAVMVTPGLRQISVVPYHKCYAGDTATLWLPVFYQPDAGLDGGISLCKDGESFLLSDQLGGQPVGGGTWSFASMPTDTVFNPATDEAGVYTYVVPDNICPDATAALTVTVNPLPEFSLGNDRLLCPGEVVGILPNSEFPAATFLWQNGSTSPYLEAQAGGEYWLELTDSVGCQGRDTVLITMGETVNVDSTVQLCEGEKFVFMGQEFFAETEECVTYTSEVGCDSIFCLRVEMLPSYHNEIAFPLESGGYNFNGEIYDQPGTYKLNFLTADG